MLTMRGNPYISAEDQTFGPRPKTPNIVVCPYMSEYKTPIITRNTYTKFSISAEDFYYCEFSTVPMVTAEIVDIGTFSFR